MQKGFIYSVFPTLKNLELLKEAYDKVSLLTGDKVVITAEEFKNKPDRLKTVSDVIGDNVREHHIHNRLEWLDVVKQRLAQSAVT